MVMSLSRPAQMVGRHTEWDRLTEFAVSGQPDATLGIVWGRRRVGKSFLLSALTEQTGGFYYSAVRGSSAEALRELGDELGRFSGAAAPLALDGWEEAIRALLRLGSDRELVVVLDEYPYLLEHTPGLDSVIQRAFGPGGAARQGSRTRLILCGSAISVMSQILSGSSPLRGRAGLDLRISSFDLRGARRLHGIDDLKTAFRTWAVIGGVAAYAREMTNSELPSGPGDFDRWVCRWVLSPSAPLFNKIPLLLSEDPATARARKLNLYHATLAGIATGHHAHGKLTRYVKLSGASLTPIVEALVAAELVTRVEDPLRDNRPTYHPHDPLIRFHYAILRRHAASLSRHGADVAGVWEAVTPTFESQVMGPAFEAAARDWVTHGGWADLAGEVPVHTGPSTLTLPDGQEQEIDVVVAADDAQSPADRRVLAIGEAKAGERITERHLRRLEEIRAALGERASGARLLLFGSAFSPAVLGAAESRTDLEVIDLERLYGTGG